MELPVWVEIVGYVASILVAISLMLTSILRLRVINLFGSILFTIYGVLIQAYPVALINAIIIFINLYHLSKLLRLEEEFSVLKVGTDREYLRRFVDFHLQDIRAFYPDFTLDSISSDHPQVIFFVLRNLLPVGLFIGEQSEEGTMLVRLDYVIPGYRDFKVGNYIFHQNAGIFREQGIQRLISYPGNEVHQRYLTRMGFDADFVTSTRRLYVLKLQ